MRGSQRVGMSTKKDAARPFGLGIFLWWAAQDENRNEQRQGITMAVVSCLLLCGIKFALCELGLPLYGSLEAIAAYVRTNLSYARTQ